MPSMASSPGALVMSKNTSPSPSVPSEFTGGATRHWLHLVGAPELVPMVVLARLDERVEVAQAALRPELAGALAAFLLLGAGRFHRATANGPAACGHLLVVHPPGVRRKIVLLAPDRLSRRAAPPAHARDAPQDVRLTASPQVVA